MELSETERMLARALLASLYSKVANDLYSFDPLIAKLQWGVAAMIISPDWAIIQCLEHMVKLGKDVLIERNALDAQSQKDIDDAMQWIEEQKEKL